MLVASDTTTRPGFVRETWQSTDVVDAEGQPGEFWWYRPIEGAETGLLLVTHGSTAADDSATACSVDAARTARSRVLEDWSLVTDIALDAGFAVLAPLDGWCDVWLGDGDADPVDTGHHGRSWLARSLAFVDEPASGVMASGRRAAWGTSTGAVGAVQAATLTTLDALVLDSGPIDFSDTAQLDFRAVLDHVLGPEERFPERWAERDPVRLLGSGALDAAVLIVSNAEDQITAASHAASAVSALSGTALTWAAHDMRHPAPGETFHVQAGLPLPPWGFYTEAWMSFALEGLDVAVQEAEVACADCVGAVTSEGLWTAASSGAEGRRSELGESGVVARFPVPDEVPEGVAVTVVAVLGVDLADIDDDTAVATLRWSGEADGQALSYGAFDVLDADSARLRSLYLSARRTLDPAAPGAALEVAALGPAPVVVDAAVFLW